MKGFMYSRPKPPILLVRQTGRHFLEKAGAPDCHRK